MAFLKACRKALGLTQSLLARLTDVSQQQISKYETGKDQIPLRFVRAIEVLWGTSFESFERSTGAPVSPERSLAMPPQATYIADLAEASPENARDSNDQQTEAMILDLKSIEDPADRQRIRDLYLTLLHKGGRV